MRPVLRTPRSARTTVLAGLLAAGVALAGCGGDADEPTTAPGEDGGASATDDEGTDEETSTDDGTDEDGTDGDGAGGAVDVLATCEALLPVLAGQGTDRDDLATPEALAAIAGFAPLDDAAAFDNGDGTCELSGPSDVYLVLGFGADGRVDRVVMTSAYGEEVLAGEGAGQATGAYRVAQEPYPDAVSAYLAAGGCDGEGHDGDEDGVVDHLAYTTEGTEVVVVTCFLGARQPAVELTRFDGAGLVALPAEQRLEDGTFVSDPAYGGFVELSEDGLLLGTTFTAGCGVQHEWAYVGPDEGLQAVTVRACPEGQPDVPSSDWDVVYVRE